MKNFFRCICILSMMISSEICYFLDFLKVYSCIPEALNSILGSIRFLKSSENLLMKIVTYLQEKVWQSVETHEAQPHLFRIEYFYSSF